ncbi:MAG: signal peptidase I [Oscillospiraceae bacterium]|jgi:signal peptidase I|nr:signal peptidase I [Oscillospiraceae bacterium]
MDREFDFVPQGDAGAPAGENPETGVALDELRTMLEETPPAAPEDEPAQPEKADEPFDFVRELYDWAHALVTSIIIVGLLFSFVARVIGVDGRSMEKTLFEDQKLIISKLLYTPKRGDIIVFTKKGIHEMLQGDQETDQPLVKRVIAVGGETVDINFETHQVFVDGALLDEPYIYEPTAHRSDVVFPQTVPKGHVFVMGDNRNMSADSRTSQVGMVDNRYILGRVLLRVWPLQDFGLVS